MTSIDTNVFIYAWAYPEKQVRAQELIAATADAVLLWQVACEFVAASRKLSSRGFMTRDAWSRLSELLELFPLILPTRHVLNRARALHVWKGLSFWDAMIFAACIECGASRLYSEGLPGGRVEGLEVLNPFLWPEGPPHAR